MLSTQFITHILLNLNKLFCIIYLNLYLFYFKFAFVDCIFGFKNTRTVFTDIFCCGRISISKYRKCRNSCLDFIKLFYFLFLIGLFSFWGRICDICDICDIVSLPSSTLFSSFLFYNLLL